MHLNTLLQTLPFTRSLTFCIPFRELKAFWWRPMAPTPFSGVRATPNPNMSPEGCTNCLECMNLNPRVDIEYSFATETTYLIEIQHVENKHS